MFLFWCVSFLLITYLGIVLFNYLKQPHVKLGVTNQRLSPCPASPNCVCSQSDSQIHFVKPIPYSGTDKQALQRLTNILNQMRGCQIVKQEEDYLHAIVRSRCFRFADDVEFWIDSRQNEIQVRSASRVGYSDLGVNRERVEAIRQQFENSTP